MEPIRLSQAVSDDQRHSLEAEAALLGSMMLEPSIVADVARQIQPGFFYRPENCRIYQAIRDQMEDAGELDFVASGGFQHDPCVLRDTEPATTAHPSRAVIGELTFGAVRQHPHIQRSLGNIDAYIPHGHDPFLADSGSLHTMAHATVRVGAKSTASDHATLGLAAPGWDDLDAAGCRLPAGRRQPKPP